MTTCGAPISARVAPAKASGSNFNSPAAVLETSTLALLLLVALTLASRKISKELRRLNALVG
jgi:hypothetical protein